VRRATSSRPRSRPVRIAGDFTTLIAGIAEFSRHLLLARGRDAGRRRLALGVLLIVGAALAGLGISKGPAVTSMALGGEADVAAQVQAGDRMARLAGRIAAPWVDRRKPETGLFVDPITGGAGHGYGPAMLAEVLIREGARGDDRRMLRAGLRALSANATRAVDDGKPGNPLELFAIASAYRWAERNLEGDEDWERYAPGPRRYLRTWESAAVGEAAQTCFASSTCWNNYKIVDAAAVLLLLDTGLEPASPAARLADPEGARAAAISILTRLVPRAIGREGEARGRSVRLSGLGMLADEPTYPLAYHAMSVAALARALHVLGDDAPPAAREHFRRAMLAQASFMAPDGDIAFLGRAQGESWALGATAYAGESCARMFEESHPDTASMCATLAIRGLERLRRMHGFRDGLLAIVPRFANAPLTDEGLEHYARVMTFNGLTAMFLGWASDETAGAKGVEPGPLPLDEGGDYVDPDRARLAVVRRESVWFAVHTIGPIGVKDLRYDFGVVSLKYRRGKRWVDVLPPRPLDDSGGPLDGGGPALVGPYGLAFPRGERFMVKRATGEVVVDGGYRTEAGTWVLRGAEFRFKPARRGVRVTATAPPGSTLRFQDFWPENWTEVGEGAVELRTPTAVSRLSVPPATLEYGSTYASAAALDLLGFRRYVTVPADGRVSWTLAARPLP
jgi:hypothetical protein